jgi:hypothetical protein
MFLDGFYRRLGSFYDLTSNHLGSIFDILYDRRERIIRCGDCFFSDAIDNAFYLSGIFGRESFGNCCCFVDYDILGLEPGKKPYFKSFGIFTA